MDTVDRFLDYPLRQCVMSADACFADVCLAEGLRKRDRYLLKSDGISARLFAANECALKEARVAVRETYGPLILFGPPEIHSFFDAEAGQTMHPMMSLRLRVHRAFTGAVMGELERRLATVVEMYVERDFTVVRAEAALSRLLGCSHSLKALTNGSAILWMWLLRYELR